VTRGSVPFLWLCGPSGVGKSAVGYEIFRQVYRSGIKAGFMDFDQFGLCYPSPADDPVPGTDLTLCRLRATPERLTERVFRRGLGRGPVVPGPPPTASRQQLAAMAAEAIREAGELDAADFADLCIDTDHHNVAQVAGLVRALAASVKGPTSCG
jgi:hypothetical protein